MSEIKPGIYKHFKGGEYEVIGVARHSETLEELVLYTHDGDYWVRQKEMWFEEVDKPELSYKGPRFIFLRKS